MLAFLRRMALASAPLIITGCGSSNTTTTCPILDKTVSVAALQGDAAVAPSADGGLLELCQRAVPTDFISSCTLVDADGGQAVHVVYHSTCGTGRRPPGLVSPAGRGTASDLGEWLAATAYLEGASVDAFAILRDELGAHGAPRALVEAASASIEDERRHERVMTRLAVAAGVCPPAVRVARSAPRDLETVARENATEGCVGETYGALVAWRQARQATDPSIREAMAVIADDETRHAALSWAIDAWSCDRLPRSARVRVRRARTEAISRLVHDVAVSKPAALRLAAGLPDGGEAVAMASSLFACIA